MKQNKIIRTFFPLAFALMAFPVFAQKAAGPDDPKAVAIIEGFERKLNLDGLDVRSDFTLVQKKPSEADRVLKIRIFRRDAKSLFTIIFQYPDSEKGKGYFRSGDDLYLYLPTTREFVYRNSKDDIGSTDVRTDLFGRLTNLEKFRATYIGTETVSKWECNVVRLDAKVLDVSFPVQKWYVRKSDGLPVKVENFSVSETLVRTFYYVDYVQISPGRFILSKLLAVNHLEEGQKTLITNENVSTAAIPDNVFSRQYLEEQSR
ncbi:MAG: outer membrane lipoprotein-sorting protein [Spirochaetaceae bacterium]|nr:MAG: outer membrane lipoprotein-sorting protein [Spirochaetaceae bacterium]